MVGGRKTAPQGIFINDSGNLCRGFVGEKQATKGNAAFLPLPASISQVKRSTVKEYVAAAEIAGDRERSTGAVGQRGALALLAGGVVTDKAVFSLHQG